MTFALLALAAFVSAVLIDFAHARYAQARDAGRALHAGAWSAAQYTATAVGFVGAVTVSVWVMPFECAGLFVGTVLAVRRKHTI